MCGVFSFCMRTCVRVCAFVCVGRNVATVVLTAGVIDELRFSVWNDLLPHVLPLRFFTRMNSEINVTFVRLYVRVQRRFRSSVHELRNLKRIIENVGFLPSAAFIVELRDDAFRGHDAILDWRVPAPRHMSANVSFLSHHPAP